MDKQTIINRLQAHASYLRKTHLPLEEVDAINHILKCAESLDCFAKELEEDEIDHQQGE